MFNHPTSSANEWWWWCKHSHTLMATGHCPKQIMVIFCCWDLTTTKNDPFSFWKLKIVSNAMSHCYYYCYYCFQQKIIKGLSHIIESVNEWIRIERNRSQRSYKLSHMTFDQWFNVLGQYWKLLYFLSFIIINRKINSSKLERKN